MNAIAEKIKSARLKAKLTEKQLAKKCGLAASYIIQIESGKKVVNEGIAEKILAVLGEKFDVDHLYNEERDEKPVEVKKEKKVVNIPAFNIQPNEQWAGAIANIIKNFPIYDLKSEKIVGEKQLPILNKKIDGIPWEKLLFLDVTDMSAKSLKIEKNSIVWVLKTKEVIDNGIYFINYENRNMIRRVKKLGKIFEIYPGDNSDEDSMKVNIEQVKIIGKCIKVEFNL